MKIHILKALKDNYIYLLTDGSGTCGVIDPGEAAPVEDFLRENSLKLTHILCTHHHWDHVNGVQQLAEAHGASVGCSQHDLSRVPCARNSFAEGTRYELFGSRLEILDLPGHTAGQIAFWFPQEKALFAGDTLFSCGCGRLFEGTHSQMYASLQKLKALPADTNLYFGHEYTLNNIRFIKTHAPASKELEIYEAQSQEKIAAGRPTSPGLLATELSVNPFLVSNTLEEFKRWRDARDVW